MFVPRLLAGCVCDALSWCRTQYDVSLPGYGWSDWLKQFSAAALIKERYCVRRRRTQSIPQGAVTNVVARLPSMLRRFLPDSSHSFGWSHICAVFVAILNFTLWGNTHARSSLSRGQLLLQSKVWRGLSLRQRLSEAVENWSDIRRKFKFKV